MKARFVALSLIGVLSLPGIAMATACKQCFGLENGENWCIGTDCDAWDVCHDTPDHSYCYVVVNYPCDGPADKWLCEQIDFSDIPTNIEDSDKSDKRIRDRSIEDSNNDDEWPVF
jgi:hypothetical protein